MNNKICKCGGENIALRMIGDEYHEKCLECGASYYEFGPDPEDNPVAQELQEADHD